MKDTDRIHAIFLHATEGIVQADSSGVLMMVNPSTERMFGYEPGELEGKKVEVLIPTRFTKHHVEHRKNFHDSPRPRSMGKGTDLYGVRKDGSEFPVEVSLSPYKTDDNHYVIAFIVDITQRKFAEDKLKNYSIELEKQVRNRTLILEEAIGELEKTKEELNAALDKERNLNELKSRFVSMASHEFRTPLATILSSLTLVTKYGDLSDKEKQQKHIHRIKSSINNLTDILNDFLSVSKLEEGKVEFVPEDIHAESFIGDIVAQMQLLVKENQHIIYCHTGDNIIRLDKKSLKNILFNLLSNAIKFSEEGKQIEIETCMSEKGFEIIVRDHGMGISKADQKHLFERFFRGQNATNIQGTGLGLNIVARYVEQMNGTIQMTSELNKGTTFKIIFTT